MLHRSGYDSSSTRRVMLMTIALLSLAASSSRSGTDRHPAPGRITGFLEPSSPACAETPSASSFNTAAGGNQRLLAGHLLRRIGFGPSAQSMADVLRMGSDAYIEQQLHPAQINDKEAESRLPPKGHDFYDDYSWMRRWYTRMVYSRRQLLEKMTLIWHEHFATSNEKVSSGCYMHEQEELLRRNALGSFRDLLIGITKDQGMLIYLDNDPNNGKATDGDGNPIPPNENFAREFLQLFTLGTAQLAMDGTPLTGTDGVPLPPYTEDDVKAAARALTGWHIHYGKCGVKAAFDSSYHDSAKKTFLGSTIVGRKGAAGAKEVQDVVEIILKQPTVAPFISKMLIQKLATESPTPEYVERVATVFAATRGDIRATVRAIVKDPEFDGDPVVRTQFKEPIEQFVGALRALGAHTRGGAVIDWTYAAGQLIYYPPSVFSFYPPGSKVTLVNTALVTIRDRVADEIVAGSWDTWFDAEALIKRRHLKTPSQAVDYLSDALLAAPLQPEVRSAVIDYMDGRVDEWTFRGAVWLLLCSPDYQRN